MEERHQRSALSARSAIERGQHDASLFRAALLGVPAHARDAWLDLVLGIAEIPADGAELPQGCVPYLPCSVDALLRVIDRAGLQASDVFVDIGSGLGRAVALVHLLTGAASIGIEVQPALALAARELAADLHLSGVSYIEGDAVKLSSYVSRGSVFFLYCPFSGERLAHWLDQLEISARTRLLRVCCVDLPLPPRAWLMPETRLLGDPTIYRSTLHLQG